MVKHNKKPAVAYNDKGLEATRPTLSALRQDSDLWYRIQVLLYDLSKVARDPLSEKRISVINPLYFSDPYFSESEATRVLTAVIDDSANIEATSPPNSSNNDDESKYPKEVTVEEAIYDRLSSFLDKRKASGDARPCGPHNMVPIYGNVFEIPKEKLDDKRFLARLRRLGLGDKRSEEGTAAKGNAESSAKGQRRGRPAV